MTPFTLMFDRNRRIGHWHDTGYRRPLGLWEVIMFILFWKVPKP